MSFTGNKACTSFKKELLSATHDFTADTFKLALYSEDANLDASTTAYSTTNEVTGTGYTAGGATLTPTTPASGSETGYVNFASVTFSEVSITARGGLIYNSSKSNKAVAVLDFGRNITKVAANFVVTMPTNDALNALIRIQ